MFSLFVLVISSVTTESYAGQALPRYSPMMLADNANPWALVHPVTTNIGIDAGKGESSAAANQCSAPKGQVPPPQTIWNFVTPEILDSLKQQQTQMQLAPQQSRAGQNNAVQRNLNRNPKQYPKQNNYGRFNNIPSGSRWSHSDNMQKQVRNRFPQNMPHQNMPHQQMQYMPQKGLGYIPQNSFTGTTMQPPMTMQPPIGSPYGMNTTNPGFDAPNVSPWGNGADVLYRGESFTGSFPASDPFSNSRGDTPSGAFPWLPAEALGGLPPMHVPNLGVNRIQQGYRNESFNSFRQDDELEEYENNVFNPFTFIQN